MMREIIMFIVGFILGGITMFLYGLFRGEDIKQNKGYEELDRVRRAGSDEESTVSKLRKAGL